MSNLHEIEVAIRQLPQQDVRELIGWLQSYLAEHPQLSLPGYDAEASSVWELAAQTTENVPATEWNKLPPDLSKRFDDYQASNQ